MCITTSLGLHGFTLYRNETSDSRLAWKWSVAIASMIHGTEDIALYYSMT